MKIRSMVLIAFSLLFFMFGCTKEQVYRGCYEGLTTHEYLKNTPGDPFYSPKSYDQYLNEREEQPDLE